jgi:aspartate carbamoyltransferase catalytic subunit
MALRHFLTLRDLSTLELQRILDRAQELKRMQHANTVFQPFVGKVLGMIFEKSVHVHVFLLKLVFANLVVMQFSFLHEILN